MGLSSCFGWFRKMSLCGHGLQDIAPAAVPSNGVPVNNASRNLSSTKGEACNLAHFKEILDHNHRRCVFQYARWWSKRCSQEGGAFAVVAATGSCQATVVFTTRTSKVQPMVSNVTIALESLRLLVCIQHWFVLWSSSGFGEVSDIGAAQSKKGNHGVI